MNINGGALSFEALWDSGSIERGLKSTEELIKNFTSLTVNSGKDIDAEYRRTAASIENGFSQIGNAINANQTEISKLTEKYNQLKQAANDAFMGKIAGGDAAYNQYNREADAVQRQITTLKQVDRGLQEQDHSLLKLNSEFEAHKAKIDNAINAQIKFRTQLANVKQQMMEMAAAGKGATPEYAALVTEAERLQNTMYAANQQVKILTSTKGQALQGIVSGLSGIAGAASVAQGAIGLFSDKNEELQKIMLKVQSLMAITIGLQQASQALHTTSAFRLTVLAKAQLLYSTAVFTTGKALVKFGVSANVARVAAQALYGTLTMGLAVAIPVVINLISKYIDRQKEAKKATEEFNKTVAESAAKPISKLNELSTAWTNLGDNIKAKENFIKEHKKDFDELGVSVKNVRDAENLLIDNKEAFISAQIAKARALVYTSQAMKDVERQIELEQNLQGFTRSSRLNADGTWSGFEYRDKKAIAIQKELNEVTTRIKKGYENAAKEETKGAKLLENASIEAIAGYTETKTSKSKEDQFTKELEERKKAYQDYFSLINAGMTAQAQQAYSTLLESGRNYREYLERRLQDEKLTAKQINKLNVELANETSKTILGEYEDSLKTQLDNAKHVLEMIDIIKSRHDELEQTDSIDPLTTEKSKILEKLNENVIKQQQEAVNKLLDEYSDYYDKRIALETELNKDLKLLEDRRLKATTDAEKDSIDQVIRNREQKYEEDKENLLRAGYEATKKLIDLGQDKELLNISKKTFKWEADRQKAILDTQIQAAKSTLKELENMQSEANTTDVAHEIEVIKLKIEELNAELEKLPAEKFQEMLSGLQQITGALGQLDGEVGELFSGISSQIDNIKVGFSETATTTDKVSAGIAGIVNIINMVTSASAKRKQAEKEFYQNQIALAHEYSLALNEQLRIQSQLAGSRFITDYAGKLNDGFNALKDATNGYYDALEKLSQGKAKIDLKNAVDWGAVGKGAASGAAAGAAIGSIIPVIGNAVGAVAGAIIGGLVGLFGGKKKKDVHDGLLDVFPELVDGAGNLNEELAQVIINTNQVDENTKQLIQNALDWADAVKEANDQIREVVVDLAGDLGNKLKSAIVDAWKAGETGSKNMFEAASESLGKFIQDLLYSTIFSQVFKDFEDDLVKSLNQFSGDGDIVDDYERLMSKMQELSPIYQNLLESINERSKQMGFDFKNIGDQSKAGLSGAIKGITQEQADMLGGQTNAIRVNQVESIEILRNQLLHLASIDMKVGMSNEYLEQIEANTHYRNYDPLRAEGIT